MASQWSQELFDEQKKFDSNFIRHTDDTRTRVAQSKEIALHLYSEVDEFYRALPEGYVKIHRGLKGTHLSPNRELIKEELVDIVKYALVLCGIWDINAKEFGEAFDRKSHTNSQRLKEEVSTSILEHSTVLVDIDNVLCDYVGGLCHWLKVNSSIDHNVLDRIANERLWINAHTLGIDEARWQELKHLFRISGGKVYLPVMEGARDFINRCREAGHQIVALTSRPFDEYPNMESDTRQWFLRNDIHIDHLMNSHDKLEKVLRDGLRHQIVLFVDDDLRHLEPMRRQGIFSVQIGGEHGYSLKEIRFGQYGDILVGGHDHVV